jgi:hypothetical protein
MAPLLQKSKADTIMSFFKKLFRIKEETPVPEAPVALWIEAEDNQWGIRVLDFRPLTAGVQSYSTDEQIANNAMSFHDDDGLSFVGIQPECRNNMVTDIQFTTDGILPYGALFIPKKMEDKWAIYFHNDELIFIRSWLRTVFVTAKTTRAHNRLCIHSITGSFTGEEDPELTTAILRFLLISHALDTTSPVPLLFPELDIPPGEILYLPFTLYGNYAQFGTFEKYQAESLLPLRTDSLLHIAVARNNIEEVKRQIKLGTDINCLCSNGLSPLHWSVGAKIIQTIEQLLSLGADPDVSSYLSGTPLMFAVETDNTAATLLLLRSGAHVNAKDHRGYTALHRAAEMGYVQILRILLENGADKTIITEGNTPASLAKLKNQSEIIKILGSV